MSKAYLNLSNSSANDISQIGWVNANPTVDVPIGLNSVADNSATGWTVTFVANIGGFPGTDGSTLDGADNAAWAPAPTLKKGLGTYSQSVYSSILISGLDDSQLYDLRFVGSVDISGRAIDFLLDGVTKRAFCYDSADSIPNHRDAVMYTGISPVSGEITIEWKGVSATGYLSAIGVEQQVASPSVTLDNNPQLGATLSFTYSNYAGIPVGPLAFDQGARSLPDEAVTITDNGDGSGSGVTDTALPDIPANGESVTPFPLIGENITITLPDPGV